MRTNIHTLALLAAIEELDRPYDVVLGTGAERAARVLRNIESPTPLDTFVGMLSTDAPHTPYIHQRVRIALWLLGAATFGASRRGQWRGVEREVYHRTQTVSVSFRSPPDGLILRLTRAGSERLGILHRTNHAQVHRGSRTLGQVESTDAAAIVGLSLLLIGNELGGDLAVRVPAWGRGCPPQPIGRCDRCGRTTLDDDEDYTDLCAECAGREE